jgi:ribosomal protein S27AE
MFTQEQQLLRQAAVLKYRAKYPERHKARVAKQNEKYKTSGKFKWWHRLKFFKITEERFIALLLKQNYLCPVCGKELIDDSSIAIDHDLKCCAGRKSCGKCIRGIIHRTCNAAIGLLNDDPAILRNAAKYLEV